MIMRTVSTLLCFAVIGSGGWGRGGDEGGGGAFQKQFELVNLGALKSSLVNKLHIFQCMGKIVWVDFQRVPLNSTQNIYPYIERYKVEI